MAVTLTMTGTNQSVSVTNLSPNVTFAAGVATNWVVGATVQGMSWPTGTKIVSITGTPATATAAVFSNNYPSTAGTGSVIVSSNNATVIFDLGASGDTATPQNIINLGLGATPAGGYKEIQIFGRTYLQLRIALGAVYDDSEWTYLFGLFSYMQVNETYAGTWRSGFTAVGDKLVKNKGATLRFQQARAVQGGTSIFTNSGAPTGYPTNKLKVQWNDFVVKSSTGSNYCMAPGAFYATFDNCGDVIFDGFDDSGANGSFSGSFGSIEKLSMGRIIGGIGTGADPAVLTTIGKIEWFPIPTFSTNGSNPDIKIGGPNNVPVVGFAPVFHQSNAALEFMGVNSTNTEIFDDYIFPTNYPLIANSRNFSSGNRSYRRTVSFAFNDTNAVDLAGVTLYIKSGQTTMLNAVQAGDYSGKLNTVFVSWTSRIGTGSYIAPVSSIDTQIQRAQFRKYGFIQQGVSYDLTNAAYSQPIFMAADSSLSGISEATASAITSIDLNLVNSSVTVTANATYDQINARIALALAQTTGSVYADPRTVTGANNVLASGWSVIVMPGVNLTSGANITYMYADTFKALSLADTPYLFNSGGILQSSGVLVNSTVLGVQGTYTGTGTITALYASSAGPSVTLQFTNVTNNGVAAVWNSSTLATELFQTNVSGSAATYTVYYPPGSAGQVKNYARELYGSQRVGGSITLAAGLNTLSFIDIPDVGITETVQATVAAYTAIETASKFYDRTAVFRLTEPGIKLGQIATRSGTAIEIGTFNHVINQAAAAVYVILSGTITTKSTAYAGDSKYITEIATPPATITAATTEVITIAREDANGDSQITIQAAGVSTFEVWKITNATNPDNYATGTLVATVGIGTWRFLSAPGFKFVIRDQTTNYRVVNTADKGIYTAELFFGAQVQLAQAAEVTEINTKVDVMQVDLEAIKGSGFTSAKNSLVKLKKHVTAMSQA